MIDFQPIPGIKPSVQDFDGKCTDRSNCFHRIFQNLRLPKSCSLGWVWLVSIQSKYGYYINYVAVTACIVVVSIIVQTWWFNRDSNSEKLPQSNPLPPPPEDPRDRFIRPNEDKDNS